MKRLVLTLTAATLAAGAASAMEPVDLDINGDGFATRAEIARLLPTLSQYDFRVLDSNDDRRISRHELLVPKARSVIVRNEHHAAVVHSISEVDTSGDRFATMAELVARYPGINSYDFREIDTNRDNRVSADELYARRAQTVISRYEAGAGFATLDEVDADGDFFASFDELVGEYPGLSALDFEEIDLNDDNRVASGEFYHRDAQSIFHRSGR